MFPIRHVSAMQPVLGLCYVLVLARTSSVPKTVADVTMAPAGRSCLCYTSCQGDEVELMNVLRSWSEDVPVALQPSRAPQKRWT